MCSCLILADALLPDMKTAHSGRMRERTKEVSSESKTLTIIFTSLFNKEIRWYDEQRSLSSPGLGVSTMTDLFIEGKVSHSQMLLCKLLLNVGQGIQSGLCSGTRSGPEISFAETD